MKKIKPAKLSLDAETIKALSEPQMRDVAGGWPSLGCSGLCNTAAVYCATVLYACPVSMRPC